MRQKPDQEQTETFTTQSELQKRLGEVAKQDDHEKATQQIAALLEANPKIGELEFEGMKRPKTTRSTHINSEHATLIMQALKGNTTIKTLRFNGIEGLEPKVAIDTLKGNTALEELGLRSQGITKRQGWEIDAAIKANKISFKIDLTVNEIDPTCISSINKAVEKNAKEKAKEKEPKSPSRAAAAGAAVGGRGRIFSFLTRRSKALDTGKDNQPKPETDTASAHPHPKRWGVIFTEGMEEEMGKESAPPTPGSKTTKVLERRKSEEENAQSLA